MATITYFIRTSSKKADTQVNIRVKFRHNNIYLYAKTPKHIEADNWDKKKQRIKQGRAHENRDSINNYLSSLETFALNAWNEKVNKSQLDSNWFQLIVNSFLDSEKSEREETTFLRYIKGFVDNSESIVVDKTGKKLSYRTIQKYKTTLDILDDFVKLNYGELFLLKEVDYEFYQEFLKYLTNTKKYAVNTVGKYIGTLKVFLNSARKKGFNINIEGFVKPIEDSDNVYLNEEELKAIYELDLSENKRLERVRDLFIVGAWTGLRFSDLSTLDKSYFINKKISLDQVKTNGRVVIPLHWMVKKIMEKYDFNLPNGISNQKFNDYLKEVCQLAEIKNQVSKSITRGGIREKKYYLKWELISSHSARRSFATNLYNSNFPTISIMAITGHKTERAFLAYIKVTPEEHAEKLLEHWNKLYNIT